MASSLRRRHRSDPMQAFDTLPPVLRRWLHQAALPWSAASARRIWRQVLAEGATIETVVARLDRAERRTLSRDAFSRPAMTALAANTKQD